MYYISTETIYIYIMFLLKLYTYKDTLVPAGSVAAQEDISTLFVNTVVPRYNICEQSVFIK